MKLACSLVSVLVFFLVVLGAPIIEATNNNWPGAGYKFATDFETVRSGKAAKNIEKLLEDRSQLDELVRPHYNEMLYVTTGVTTRGVVVGSDKWLFPASRLRAPGRKKLESLPDTCAAVADVAEWFESQGAVVIFELIPRKHTLYPEQLPDKLDYPYESYFQLVFDTLVEKGVWVPDLRPILRPKEGVKEDVYYLINDDHWNCDGCFAAAEHIAGLLKERFGEAGIPGRPSAVKTKRMPAEPFIGTPQRMLGFSKGSWLFNRFTRPHERITSVLVANEQKEVMGSTGPEPVLLVGTSFSANPFRTASQLIALLGVEVQNHAYGGFAGGYRMAEVGRDIMTGRRESPELLVWEFPEDFPLHVDQYFREPLQSILDVAPFAPYSAGPIEASEPRLNGIVAQGDKKGMTQATSSGPEASITYDLTEPLPGDGKQAFSFDFNCFGKGAVRGDLIVEWGSTDEETMPNRKVVLMQSSSRAHPILVRLPTVDGAPIKHIRIRPHTLPTRIEFGNVEVWKN